VWRDASLYSRGFFVGRKFTRAGRQLVCVIYFLGCCGVVRAAAVAPRQVPTFKRAMKFVTDETGRRVAIPFSVQRIVTLAPDLTETVYALGLEDKLAADTTFCDTPAAAKLKPHIGSPQTPSLEAIVAMHPDLVLATTSINRPETVDALLRLGISVYTSDPHTVHGMLDSIARMADLMGANEQGTTLVAQLQARLDAVHARIAELPLVHVLFVVWEDPLITIGQNTFIADALRWAGAESVIVADQNWPRVSMEEIVRLQPEYILFTANHSEANDDQDLNRLRTRPGWKALKAIQMGRIVKVDDEITKPSPGLVGAIEEIARALHPDVFSSGASGESFKFQGGMMTEVFADIRRERERDFCAL
jgi:iron complex transport system substrate-binding protein